MSTDYAIETTPFAERHYIKSFEKKYKGAWDVARRAIEEQFKRFDALFATSIAETIVDGKDIKICKAEFRIAGRTKESRKSSGNRCIVAIHKESHVVRVLLVYHKNDLGGENETAAWKQKIKDNYPEYRSILSG